MSKEQLKKYGTTFHFASQFLSAKHIKSAANLYAICRQIDDIADTTYDNEQAKDELLALKQALIDEDASHPVVQTAKSIEPEICLDTLVELTDGVLSDTDAVHFQSELDLMRYCYQVAGTVGLLMCDLFEIKNPIARHHAVDLGVAMQLTNICRDVLEDANNGRVYLPEMLIGPMSARGVAEATGTNADRIRDVVSYLLTEADVRYESGISGLSFLPTQPRLAILVAALSYREIGMIVAERGFDIWAGRAYTTKAQKTLIAFKGVMTFLFSRRLRVYQGSHDSSLHRGLHRRPGVHWA
jgi:phytoene synthase